MTTSRDYHVEAMERFAAANFRSGVGPGDVARAVGLHPSYAAVLFKRARGRTLGELLTGLRVARAVDMLRGDCRGPGAISRVAAACGFSSMSRFYEAFREATGRRPGQVRGEQVRGEQVRGEQVRGEQPPTALPPHAHSAADARSVQGRSVQSSCVVHALWVDDHPLNNLRERRAFAAIGIFADTCRSNEEAAAALAQAPFGLIISDISRGRGGASGWALAQHVRAHHPATPILFYCGFVDLHRRRIAASLGAAGICSMPAQLLDAAGSYVGT